MTLRLKKLTITENGLKHTSSIDPMLFLSLEFFDFELQTTPLIQGPESVFEYSTVYDILISNLFIHYIETEGITIELFEVKGVAYDQKGAGIISLKKLLETETPAMISGKLRLFLPGSKETVMAQLEYQLEVPFSLIKALKAQKRRLTASSYLPLDSSIPSTLYNEIEILIHRCSNLQVLTKSKQLPSTYVAYQIYDLQPHLTQIQSKNANPVYNDSRAFTLPIGMALHRYLKTEELQIYVVEENSERANRGKELGSIILPLFPLARNQSIKGTFSLTTSDGQVSEATIDLSIYWKYAYTFNDENVEVEEPVSEYDIQIFDYCKVIKSFRFL
uniref:C2 domain-containing protein n=1 Tax=Panagrolaimus superbus TaxID=310955 RepID=A0A914YXJ7_9BILA